MIITGFIASRIRSLVKKKDPFIEITGSFFSLRHNVSTVKGQNYFHEKFKQSGHSGELSSGD